MTYTEEGKRHIQNYGEQHPDFHSKEMKKYRSDARNKAIQAKKITLKSGEEITAGKKYREKKHRPLKSWGDELPRWK